MEKLAFNHAFGYQIFSAKTYELSDFKIWNQNFKFSTQSVLASEVLIKSNFYHIRRSFVTVHRFATQPYNIVSKTIYTHHTYIYVISSNAYFLRALVLLLDSLWTVHPLESLRIWNQTASPSQKVSLCRYTQASGTLMIGPRGVGLSRRIGAKPLLRPLTEISRQKHAYGPQEHPLVPQRTTAVGLPNRSTLRASKGWNGPRRTTWFTTIARILSASLKDFLLSAHSLKQQFQRIATKKC